MQIINVQAPAADSSSKRRIVLERVTAPEKIKKRITPQITKQVHKPVNQPSRARKLKINTRVSRKLLYGNGHISAHGLLFCRIPLRTRRVIGYIHSHIRIKGYNDKFQVLGNYVSDEDFNAAEDDDIQERIDFAKYADDRQKKIRNVLIDIPSMTKYIRDGLNVKIKMYIPGKQLVKVREKNGERDIISYCVSLTERNMKLLYTLAKSGWSWDSKEKRRELEDKDARILVAYTGDREHPEPVGFVHFRFLKEDEAAVLYVYELQLDVEILARKGLGTHFMKLLEDIAENWEMDWIMLTVFNRNERALNFYDRLGYAIDETSPTMTENNSNKNDPNISKPSPLEGYRILSKKMF